MERYNQFENGLFVDFDVNKKFIFYKITKHFNLWKYILKCWKFRMV